MDTFIQRMFVGNTGLWGVRFVCVCISAQLPISNFDQRTCAQNESKHHGGSFDDTGTVDWLHNGDRDRIYRIAIWNWPSATLDSRAATFSASFDARPSKTHPPERGVRCRRSWRGELRAEEQEYSELRGTIG